MPWKLFNFIYFPLCPKDREEGFTREWASTSDQRMARRQMEVQVNDQGNPQYRTVAAPSESEVPNYENPEERKWIYLFDN